MLFQVYSTLLFLGELELIIIYQDLSELVPDQSLFNNDSFREFNAEQMITVVSPAPSKHQVFVGLILFIFIFTSILNDVKLSRFSSQNMVKWEILNTLIPGET